MWLRTMKFKGKRPNIIFHRKINGERRCICGAYLTPENGDWTHPEVNEEDDIVIEQNKAWMVKVPVISNMCPFRRIKFGEDNICLHGRNTSGICSEKNCRKKID